MEYGDKRGRRVGLSVASLRRLGSQKRKAAPAMARTSGGRRHGETAPGYCKRKMGWENGPKHAPHPACFWPSYNRKQLNDSFRLYKLRPHKMNTSASEECIGSEAQAQTKVAGLSHVQASHKRGAPYTEEKAIQKTANLDQKGASKITMSIGGLHFHDNHIAEQDLCVQSHLCAKLRRLRCR